MKRIREFFKKLFNDFKIVLFNEQTLVEEHSFKLSPLKLILFLFSVGIIFIGFYILFSYLFTDVFASNPQTAADFKRHVITLKKQVDELETQTENNNSYINELRDIISDKKTTKLDTTKYVMSDQELLTQEVTQTASKEIEPEQPTSVKETSKIIEKSSSMSSYIIPVKGTISATYNANLQHFATDIAATIGTPIQCIANGICIFSDWTTSTGFVIIVQHNNGMISVYKHASKLLKKQGQIIKQGETIALVGNTGKITSGPHLHLELWKDGKPQNAQQFIKF